ncbi:hypothetical protein V4C53_11095 [Paraburkholderia azotifigens]|uniref:hypothetical protein n=1 Tax=Paraburkholderia azotifigens TaxID=2057004 RepID=UPI00316E6947
MDEIDDVLTQWYEWSQTYKPALGFGGASVSCRGFRISNQWMDHDDLSHLVDSQLRETVGRAVDPIVMRLAIHHRIAVMVVVRSFAAGDAVDQNPYKPTGQDEDYAEAKAVMRPALIARGLLRDCVQSI